MAHSHSPRPEPRDPIPAAPKPTPGQRVQFESDLGQVASTLAAQGLQSTELALDLILHDLAERARLATGASGAAIALERNGQMVCRAAAGATAPDLGVRINSESGLTGACVRERKRAWCSDTETDPRVDAEACRQLGVRCIAVVPVFSAQRLVGVFEIFSPEPNGFREDDLKTLQDLAQWVTEAIQSASGKAAARQESVPAIVPGSGSSAAEAVPPEPQGNLEFPVADNSTRMLRATVLGLATVLVLMLGFRWGWQRAHSNRQPEASLTTAAPAGNADIGPEQDLPPNATPERLGSRVVKPAAEKHSALQAQNELGGLVVYKDGNVVFRQKPSSAEHEGRTTSDAALPKTQAASAPAATNTASEPANATTTTKPAPEPPFSAPRALLSSAGPGITLPAPDVSVPVPALRVSQVTGGELIHRVAPQYPDQAKQQRLEGEVVLQAVIGKDGSVRDVKALRGNAMLVAAAIDAVRRWRYQPFKLDGDPVERKTEITIKFALPQ